MGNPEVRGRAAAEEMRTGLGMDDAPIADMFDFVESHIDVYVSIEPMPTDVDGMLMTDPATGKRCIAVATSEVLQRQRFTLGHELGHATMGALSDHVRATGTRSEDERAADAFARHLLLPIGAIERIRAAAAHGATMDEHLSTIVRTYCVSPAVAGIQMREQGWVDQHQVDTWKQWNTSRLATRFGWRSEYDSWTSEASKPRPPRRLLQRTIDAYISRKVPTSAVATVAGIGVDATQEMLNQAAISPSSAPITWFDPDT